MKLLFVSQTPDNRLMGVPRVLRHVADRLRRRGHVIEHFWEEDAPRVWLKRASLLEWAVRAAPAVAERCRRGRHDAVVVTSASGVVLSSFRKALLPGRTRIVSWHHGFEAMMWEQMLAEERAGGVRFSKRFKLYYAAIVWAARHSIATQDAAMLTSHAEREWLRRHHPRHAGKIFYLPNGVSRDFHYPERPWSDAAGRPIRLLFLGYWDPWRKGRRYLAEAFARLRRRHPDIRLTLAGTRLSAAEILPDFAPETHAAIEIIPHLDEAASVAMYRDHDLFLLPSLFEGLPLVLLEAMASAMPVVTTDACGMRDIIRHYENGLLVPRRDVTALAEAVSHLVENPTLRQQLGMAAYDTVKTYYTWEQIADLFENHMACILQGQSAGGALKPPESRSGAASATDGDAGSTGEGG